MGGGDKIVEAITIHLADYQPHPRNYNRHPDAQVADLARSLTQWGQAKPIVVWGGYIITGHGVVAAARSLGWETVQAVDHTADWTEQQALAYLVADNELSRKADPDHAQLAALLDEVQRTQPELVEAAGYTAKEIEQLLAMTRGPQEVQDAEPQIDRAEELRVKWGVEPGDLWQLADHRIVCGDCTDAETVARVMAGDLINLAFTSPPYAEQRDYDESSGFKPIPPREYVAWFAGVSSNVQTHLAADGSWFVNIKPAAEALDTELYVFDLVIAHVREWGWHFVTEFCWERAGIPKQVVRRFKNQFEPVYQFVRGDFKFRPDNVRHESKNVPRARGKGAGNTSWAKHQGGESIFMSGMQGIPDFKWFGDNVGEGMAYPGNRLPTFSDTHEALGHAAAFPVGLPEFFVRAYTDPRDVVYEPFAGSGSTLMAAENQGRKCRAVELSPSYAAIILQRWTDATGKAPERIGSVEAI
jgi:DNA modification methylase